LERFDLVFLDHPQELGLDANGNVADFVQKQAAAVRFIEKARLVAFGARESTFRVPEKLALQKVLRDAWAVDGDELLLSLRANFSRSETMRLQFSVCFSMVATSLAG
jgi:hypothetical protein